jgi:hypothetical protein
MSLEHDDEPPPASAAWDLFRRDEPEPRAIQAAYLRFAARRPERVSALLLLRWLTAGFVLGWGVAFAATGDPLFGAGLRRAQPAAAAVSRVMPSARPSIRAPERTSDAPSALAPLDRAAPEPKPSSTGAHAFGSAPPSVLAESTATDPKWQRAAAALKARDYAAAETALREVETAGAPNDRDPASLALAQVLLTRGRMVEARARLERLSVHASSPLVREKATALLADSASAGRSAATPAVPQ